MYAIVRKRRGIGLLLWGVTFWLLAGQVQAAFEDDENCLMCHKYPKMGRVTDEGVFRSYYVIPHVFARTVHRNVPCRDCHSYIKELPHRPVKVGVQCDSECHSIKNPATGKRFSHKPIYDRYIKSVHGRPKVAKGPNRDKPYCVTCHTNPIYNPKEQQLPEHIVQRCVVCHEDRDFVEDWYKHTSRRIREVKRDSRQIVQLCANCHGDQRLVKRHLNAARLEGRELGRKYPYAVESYLESFHGKVTHYGFKKAANCVDCHVDQDNYYLNVHFIRPSRDPVSPVSPERKLQTCRRCHKYADENYARLDPHPTSDIRDNPFRHYAEVVYGWVGDIVLAMLIGMALLETIGRWRDGVVWRIRKGSSWWRKSRRNRDRVI